MIWKARDEVCFNHAIFSWVDVLIDIQIFAWDMKLHVHSFNGFHLDPVNGRWTLLHLGYVKLNIDGSVRDGNATYGGLLRYSTGQWLWGLWAHVVTLLHFKLRF